MPLLRAAIFLICSEYQLAICEKRLSGTAQGADQHSYVTEEGPKIAEPAHLMASGGSAGPQCML